MIYEGFVDHEVGVLQYFWPRLAIGRPEPSA